VLQQERLHAVGQMASGIAHDINNAISPVMLYAESLLEQETALSADGREDLEIIRRAVEDVAQTVARLGEFYRPHSPDLSLAPVQVNRLIRQVTDLTRARWSDMPQQRGVVIHLRTELAAELPAVAGVESEIREALINLLFNAVDAMPEGGTLTLRTRLAEETVQVEVADTGAGMTEETQRRCLEPFFTTKGDRGTGLGLAMVYGVAQRHKAEIDLSSAPGRGTTVRITFPVPRVAIESAWQEAVLAAIPPLHILIVDDDPMILKSLHDILQVDGHTVTSANGGQQGIDAFKAAGDRGEKYSLVITDLGMPYVDGRRVAGEVKRMSASTPVILLTGWGQRLKAEHDLPVQVDCVLSKPPKLRELREALAYCLDPRSVSSRQLVGM
jgi:CheY-like chemotaxis protein